MKVLVTGVTGRVGSNVAGDMVSKGVEVRGMVMPGDALAGKARPLRGSARAGPGGAKGV